MKWTDVVAVTIVAIATMACILTWQIQTTSREYVKQRIAPRYFGYGYVTVDK